MQSKIEDTPSLSVRKLAAPLDISRETIFFEDLLKKLFKSKPWSINVSKQLIQEIITSIDEETMLKVFKNFKKRNE